MLLTVNKMYYPELGGVEVVAKNIVDFSKDYFDNCEVLTFSKGKEYIQEEKDQVKIHRLGYNYRYEPFRFSNNYKKKLAELSENAEIVLFHFPSAQPEVHCLLDDYKFIKAKKVCLYHSDVSNLNVVSWFYNNILVEKYLSQMDYIVVTSPNIVESSPVLGKFRDRIKIIPLGIDTEYFYYREDNKRKYILDNIPAAGKDSKLLLYLGRLDWYKGIPYLVKALKMLPENYVLAIVGKGIKEKEIRKEVVKNGLEKRVAFFNHIPYADMPGFYSAADLFVLPSISRVEAFGLVAIEAMACGVPLVSTEIGTGTSYHNVENVTGRIVEPKNETLLADAIKYVVENKEKFPKDIVRKRAEEFSLLKFKERWLDFFKSISK